MNSKQQKVLSGRAYMDSQEKISVIIPTYNSARYISKTLDSVYNQTVLPYEIVICDDGSEDDTVAIIQKYVKKREDIFDNVKIIEQVNNGAGAARNNAIKNATGEWIAFLDSDDLWTDTKLELVTNAILAHRDVGIFSHDEYGVFEGDMSQKTLAALHKYYDPSESLFLQLFWGNFFSTSCMVIKKDIIERAGYFDTQLLSAQDYDLWLRVSKDQKAYFIEEPLECYVTRKDNISAKTYRRYKCEMVIVKKYTSEVIRLVGVKTGKKIILKRICRIHLIETYAAIRRKQIGSALKIAVQLLPQMIKAM